MNLKWKKIAILWYWKEWQSTYNFLVSQWVSKDLITILDQNPNTKVPQNTKAVLWNNYLNNLESFDIIFRSPWVSPYQEKLLKVKDKLTTQAYIFFEKYNWKVIWITWTKGKSTTSTLIYLMLQKAKFLVSLVWNIWKPVLEEQHKDFVVFELSSYMLEDLKPKLFIWILLNIYPDHLQWHNWFESYRKAKLNILENAKYKIVNSSLKKDVKDAIFYPSDNIFYIDWKFFVDKKPVFDDKHIKLLWDHNKENILSVLAVAKILQIDYQILKEVLTEFKWLPHRLEIVWTYRWITFVDDAISTTPESTAEAIKTFWERIDTIFLGWEDRWYDFYQLVNYIKKYNIKNVVLFPTSWEKIYKLLDSNFNILLTDSMKEAVKFAYKYTQKWKICLLSCASPSYSLWKNYEKKWEEFKQNIISLWWKNI